MTNVGPRLDYRLGFLLFASVTLVLSLSQVSDLHHPQKFTTAMPADVVCCKQPLLDVCRNHGNTSHVVPFALTLLTL